MFALSVPLLLCLAVTAYGFPEGQIVGGEDAPIGEFPYQVSLRYYGTHFCGASIIDIRTVLTSAHCVIIAGKLIGNLSAISVHAGTNQLNTEGDAYEVEKIVAHSNYSSLTLRNDIALIRVEENIVFNNLVQPIALASGSNTYEGDMCILSGWGATSVVGVASNNLEYIDLVLESEAQCKEAFPTVTESNICTFTKFGEGACHGDSGGPLVHDAEQIGVLSFGLPCAVGKPDVYTRVTSFTSWINSHQNYMNQDINEEPADGVYIS